MKIQPKKPTTKEFVIKTIKRLGCDVEAYRKRGILIKLDENQTKTTYKS